MGVRYFDEQTIRDDDGLTTYTPFLGDHGQVGYFIRHDDGRVTYLYLNPSGGSDDGVANVFVYQDDMPEAFVGAMHHYDVWEGEQQLGLPGRATNGGVDDC